MSVNKKLSQFIISLAKEDQRLRKGAMKKATEKSSKAVYNWDKKVFKEIEKIIEKYGWPSFDLIGKKAAHDFWLLVQHADQQPNFQKKCLKLMEKAVKKNQANAKDFTYLTDRVLCAEGKKQKFGTQFEYSLKEDKMVPKPILNLKNINKLRAK